MNHYISVTCHREKCRSCGGAATHKIIESEPFDLPKEELDVVRNRAILSAYLCCFCFTVLMTGKRGRGCVGNIMKA